MTVAILPIMHRPACGRPSRRLTLSLVLLCASLLYCLPGRAAPSAAPQAKAAIYLDAAAGGDAAFGRELAGHARAAGYAAEFIDAAALCNPTMLSAEKYALVVLPNGRELPAPSAPALEGYLKRGGDLLALGLPLWASPSLQMGGQWLNRTQYDQLVAAQRPERLLEDFRGDPLSKWTRSSNERTPRARYELVDQDQRKALHVVVQNLTGWENLASPSLAEPFPPQHVLTCFRAKGGAGTPQLMLEWTEQDGSRWIATVGLGTQWRNYVLAPEDFKPWLPPPGRGGKGDTLNVRKAVRFIVGLAISHTAVEGPRQEYWFGDLGTARHPLGAATRPAEPSWPRLEGLAPEYHCFPITGPVVLAKPGGAVLAPGQESPPLYGLQPRPRGVGYEQGRPWRWQPLLEAHAGDGDYRGAVAIMLVHTRPPFRGGVWAGFTPADPAFYRPPAMQSLLREVLTAMNRGLFLLEGGAEFFTVFPDQTFRLGARVANFSPAACSNLTVRLTAGVTGSRAYEKTWPLDLPAGAERAVEATWKPPAWPEGGFEVAVELGKATSRVDQLAHPLQVWRPKPRLEFVEARGGGFWWRDQPWKVHGVNYMPSSGIGLADHQYFEYWLGRGAYDPEVIERDLRRIKAMGLNAVSVFVYHQSLGAQHLLDFLRRCEALGLRVNQSLRPGTPMDFRWNQVKELIEFYRLAQNDTVFAYDLAWEPSHYDQAYQEKHYTAGWQDWARRRYGTWTAATNQWRYSPRTAPAAPAGRQAADLENLAVPAADQLGRDGPWRRLVADYRCFLDELLRDKYAEARRLVKTIDPRHPVSFRMQMAGDPTHNQPGLLPYDFYGLAEAVDLWEPEAYGRIGDWDRVKAGHFTAAYARLCDGRKPVLWAEMGYSVWDMKTMAPQPQKLQFAARFYADFYRMLRESGADGVFFWWYPGGLRLNESSDYGIINPDGTDREITRVIRAEGARFLQAAKPGAPNHWITVDRDRDARGLYGLYEAVKDEYWAAVAAGQGPGLKWRKKPGQSETP